MLVPSPVVGSVSVSAGGAGDSVKGFADAGDGGADFALSGSFTPSASGILDGSLAGLDPAARNTVGSVALYQIDLTSAVMIETDAHQLALGYLENLP